MRTWGRLRNGAFCGYCGTHLDANTPVCTITIIGVERQLIRCQLCEGLAPADLPLTPNSTGHRATEPMSQVAASVLEFKRRETV